MVREKSSYALGVIRNWQKNPPCYKFGVRIVKITNLNRKFYKIESFFLL